MSYRPLASSLAIVLGLAVSGCVAVPEDFEPEELGTAADEIRDGYTDETDTAVVGIVAFFGNEQGICSGSLIAPNVVLTARHCVSNIKDDVNGGVACGVTGFTPPQGPEDFFVTTQTEMPFTEEGYRTVREVVLLPVDDKLCGQDQAILILNDLIPPEEALPLVPRIDEPILTGEEYYAVGYGATNDAGSGAGLRRRRDTLFIECVAEECPAFSVKATEWVGDKGICQGDSGGPSLDLKNRVIGVTSRGALGCEDPIYGYVLSWGQWIKDTVIHAAELGGYQAPAWATGYPTDPIFSAPVGDKCEGGETCTSGICLKGYCSRPCTDVAACPSGYSCKGEEPLCYKDTKKAAEEEGSGISCSMIQPHQDPTKPIPWYIGAALGALALLRRRRR